MKDRKLQEPKVAFTTRLGSLNRNIEDSVGGLLERGGTGEKALNAARERESLLLGKKKKRSKAVA